MVELLGGGMLEAGDLAALGVDARHDVLDRAVLAGGVHRLEDEQDRPAIGRVEPVLGLGQRRDVLGEDLLGEPLALGLGQRGVAGPRGVVILEPDRPPVRDPRPFDEFVNGRHDGSAPGVAADPLR